MRGLCHQLISQYQTSGTVWEVRCLEVALTCAFCWKDLRTAHMIHLKDCANSGKLFCHVETPIKTSQVRRICYSFLKLFVLLMNRSREFLSQSVEF